MDPTRQVEQPVYVEKYAQHLILDIGQPITPQGLHYIISFLDKTLCVASILRGPTRIPLFGLSVINNQLIPLFRLGDLKGQYSRIREVLNEVYSISTIASRPSLNDYNDYLLLAVKSALEDFKPFELNVNECPVVSRLEITLVTMKNGILIQDYLQSMVASLSFGKLRKIKVVQLCESGVVSSAECQDESVVDLIMVSTNSNDLHDVFGSWLTHREVDREQVHLYIGDRRKASLRLDCDLSEAVLDPNLLPYPQRYILNGSSLCLPTRPSMIRSSDCELSFYELEVIGKLSNNGVCESYIFGLPVLITPHVRSSNNDKQTFYSLCSALIESEEYLLARLIEAEPPYGLFVLIPDYNRLLGKCIAGSEIALPQLRLKVGGDCPEFVHDMVTASLATIQHHDVYIPQQFECEILPSIVKSGTPPRRSPAKKPYGRKKARTESEGSSKNLPYDFTPNTGGSKTNSFKEQQDMLKYFKNCHI